MDNHATIYYNIQGVVKDLKEFGLTVEISHDCIVVKANCDSEKHCYHSFTDYRTLAAFRDALLVAAAGRIPELRVKFSNKLNGLINFHYPSAVADKTDKPADLKGAVATCIRCNKDCDTETMHLDRDGKLVCDNCWDERMR